MNWYAAHVLMLVRLKKKRQTHFPAWENIILIQADSEDEAFQKAGKRGRQDAGDDDSSFHWGKEPAEWVFAGVRKVTSCQDENKRPGDGTELTFLEMEFASQAAIQKIQSLKGFVSGLIAALYFFRNALLLNIFPMQAYYSNFLYH